MAVSSPPRPPPCSSLQPCASRDPAIPPGAPAWGTGSLSLGGLQRVADQSHRDTRARPRPHRTGWSQRLNQCEMPNGLSISSASREEWPGRHEGENELRGRVMKNKENKWTPGRAPAQPREAARGRQWTPPEAREGARSGLPGCPRRCPTGPCVLKETRGGPGLRAPCSVLRAAVGPRYECAEDARAERRDGAHELGGLRGFEGRVVAFG